MTLDTAAIGLKVYPPTWESYSLNARETAIIKKVRPRMRSYSRGGFEPQKTKNLSSIRRVVLAL